MSDSPAQPGRNLLCTYCRGTGHDGDRDESDVIGRCFTCGAEIFFEKGNVKTIHVHGTDAAEVEAVTRQLSSVALVRRETAQLRSPWFSGLFYLTAVVVVSTLLLVVAQVLAAWTLPVMIVGSVLLVSTIGAFQLRADDRLSERNFVKLMTDVLRRAPEVLKRRQHKQPADE